MQEINNTLYIDLTTFDKRNVALLTAAPHIKVTMNLGH